MFVVRILENIDRVIMAPHCIWFSSFVPINSLFPGDTMKHDFFPLVNIASGTDSVLLAPSHYLSQCGITINKIWRNMSQCIFCENILDINSSAPGKCGSNFFKSVISEHKLWTKFMTIFCELLCECCVQNNSDNMSTLVQVMAWGLHSGTNSLPESVLTKISDAIWHN